MRVEGTKSLSAPRETVWEVLNSPERMAKLMPGVEMCKNPYEAAKDADALVILTEWDAYRALDLDRLKRELKQPLVVDLRNIYRPEEMTAKGFHYFSVGRPAVGQVADPRLP